MNRLSLSGKVKEMNCEFKKFFSKRSKKKTISIRNFVLCPSVRKLTASDAFFFFSFFYMACRLCDQVIHFTFYSFLNFTID